MEKLNKEKIIELAGTLPPVSTASIELLSIIDQTKTTKEQIIKLLKTDETLFASCFKHANSAAVGAFKQFQTINEIVDTLGISLIKKVAIYTAAKSAIADPKIWYESVFTAVAADYLARKHGYDERLADAIYMAGLFQNYGSYLFKYCFSKEYNEISQTNDFKKKLAEETTKFGFNSLETSTILLEDHHIPEYVIEVIKNQPKAYSPTASKENIILEIARLLYTMQDKDVEELHKKLDTAEVSYLVTCSGIEVIDLDESLMSLLKQQSSQFL